MGQRRWQYSPRADRSGIDDTAGSLDSSAVQSLFGNTIHLSQKPKMPDIAVDDAMHTSNELKMRRAATVPFVIMVLIGFKMILDPFDEGERYTRWRDRDFGWDREIPENSRFKYIPKPATERLSFKSSLEELRAEADRIKKA